MFKLLCAGCLILFSGTSFAAGERFQEAESSYQQGDFSGALSAYERAWQEGMHNSALLYNLGDAAYRSDELGKSVAAFLAAREIDPRDENTKTNLSFALRKVSPDLKAERFDRNATLSAFQPLFSLTAEEAYTVLALLWFFGLTPLALAAFIAVSRGVKVFAFFILMGALYMMAGIVVRRHLPQWAAVCSKSLTIHAEPSPDAPALSVAAEGTPVLIDTYRQSWVKVAAGDVTQGWVEGKDLCYFDVTDAW